MLTREEIAEGRRLARDAELAAALARRPRTRADCRDGERPCPWCSCRWHLALEVTPEGRVVLPHGDIDLERMSETCALDVAERGGATLEEVGQLLGLTRERIRQLEAQALGKLRNELEAAGITPGMLERLGEPGESPLAEAERWAPERFDLVPSQIKVPNHPLERQRRRLLGVLQARATL